MFFRNVNYRNFPGSPVAKSLSCSAGDMGSIPGLGTKIPHAVKKLSLRVASGEPVDLTQPNK